MTKMYGFNPSRCNSASTLSGCIERELLKVMSALQTNADVFEMLEKILPGRFCCVNTRLGFDNEISTSKSFSNRF